jgi:formamidopyrimidine-DNA glycosylase
MLRAAFADRMAPAKALLLDQRLVAGLGNIYVCEALFRAGIHPARAGGRVAGARIDRLAAAVVAVLGEAIAAGGSSLRDHAAPDGTLGYFQKGFQVYGREGGPCPVCARPIERIVQSGRSSFLCAKCQR